VRGNVRDIVWVISGMSNAKTNMNCSDW